MKLKVGHYFDKMWKCNFYFCLGWPEKAFVSWMEKTFKHTPENIEGASGKCYSCKKRGGQIIVLWTRRRAGVKFYATLAHESVHAANFCLYERGVEVHYDNDEPLAYLVDTIFSEALDTLP